VFSVYKWVLIPLDFILKLVESRFRKKLEIVEFFLEIRLRLEKNLHQCVYTGLRLRGFKLAKTTKGMATEF
jgi:hypothetical protein